MLTSSAIIFLRHPPGTSGNTYFMTSENPIEIPRCPRPTEPGYYLCWQPGRPRPEVVEIRLSSGVLFYQGGLYVPLNKVNEDSLFFGPIILGV
jgi:hypothetical protein